MIAGESFHGRFVFEEEHIRWMNIDFDVSWDTRG
jgi:hypothetical protein